MRAIHRKFAFFVSTGLAAAVLGGCAVAPTPAPIQRLPQGELSKYAPTLTREQAKKLTELDARILKEQEDTIRNERAWAAYNAAYQNYWNNASFYGTWGGPYYGYGVGFGSPWPYYGYPYYGYGW